MPISRRAPNEPPTAALHHVPAYDPAPTQKLPPPAPLSGAVFEEYAPPPPRGPRIWPWLLALIVLLLLGIGIGIGYGLTRDNGAASASGRTTPALSSGVVPVPNVVGRRADRAASGSSTPG